MAMRYITPISSGVYCAMECQLVLNQVACSIVMEKCRSASRMYMCKMSKCQKVAGLYLYKVNYIRKAILPNVR